MAEVDPPPIRDVNNGTLQINGVMSRLPASKMDVQKAATTCMELTEKIDDAASNISSAVKRDNTALRRELKSVRNLNVKLHQRKYQLETELKMAHEKIVQLKAEGEQLLDTEMLSFSQSLEESLSKSSTPAKQGETSANPAKQAQTSASPAKKGEATASQCSDTSIQNSSQNIFSSNETEKEKQITFESPSKNGKTSASQASESSSLSISQNDLFLSPEHTECGKEKDSTVDKKTWYIDKFRCITIEFAVLYWGCIWTYSWHNVKYLKSEASQAVLQRRLPNFGSQNMYSTPGISLVWE